GGAEDDYFFGLGGNDKLEGGPGKDLLVGGGGNDFLDGGPGADVMFGDDTGFGLPSGPPGNDTYVVDDLGDTIVDAGGTQDLVLVTVSGYTLPDGIEIGAVTTPTGLTLTGNDQIGRA